MADVHVGNVVYGDKIKVGGHGNVGKVVNMARPADPPAPQRHRILMLMSNPPNTGPLRLDEEYRSIDQAIVGARYGSRLELRVGAAVRAEDLQALLLRHEPVIVHYSGHNNAAAGIVLADARGGTHMVPPAALSDLFAIVGRSIKCVVLNACLTHDQAAAIAVHVPCVVGMSRAVLDSVAIDFAAAFYHALGDGQSVATAFRLGRNRLNLSAPSGSAGHRDATPIDLAAPSGADDPVLIAAPHVAEQVFITP